jgi:hypothetical protein
MKKTIMACLIMLSVTVKGIAQRSNSKHAEKFQHSFANNFPGASVNVWDTQGDFIIARFFLNEIKYDAWFADDASLYAVVKFTTLDQLPEKFSAAIKKQYGIKDAVSTMDIVKPNGRRYYVTKIWFKNSLKTVRVNADGSIDELSNEYL